MEEKEREQRGRKDEEKREVGNFEARKEKNRGKKVQKGETERKRL